MREEPLLAMQAATIPGQRPIRTDDAMVSRLFAGKREEVHEDYVREAFERALAAAFEVERREVLGSGTRTLYLARPR